MYRSIWHQLDVVHDHCSLRGKSSEINKIRNIKFLVVDRGCKRTLAGTQNQFFEGLPYIQADYNILD